MDTLKRRLKQALETSDGFSLAITLMCGKTDNWNLFEVFDDCLEVEPVGVATPNRTYIMLSHVSVCTVEEG